MYSAVCMETLSWTKVIRSWLSRKFTVIYSHAPLFIREVPKWIVADIPFGKDIFPETQYNWYRFSHWNPHSLNNVTLAIPKPKHHLISAVVQRWHPPVSVVDALDCGARVAFDQHADALATRSASSDKAVLAVLFDQAVGGVHQQADSWWWEGEIRFNRSDR